MPPISGNISSTTYEAVRAGLPMGKINTASVPLAADNKTWPCGLVMGKKADGKFTPYGSITELAGTGDGTEKSFTAQVGPIEPGSVSLVAGAVTLADDGCGNLTSAGGSGSVNYQTGKVIGNFTVAPANAAEVNLTHKPDPCAVLDAETDTSVADSAIATKFGAVKKTLLKVGVDAPATPAAAVFERLALRHIHAV